MLIKSVRWLSSFFCHANPNRNSLHLKLNVPVLFNANHSMIATTCTCMCHLWRCMPATSGESQSTHLKIAFPVTPFYRRGQFISPTFQIHALRRSHSDDLIYSWRTKFLSRIFFSGANYPQDLFRHQTSLTIKGNRPVMRRASISILMTVCVDDIT